MVVGTDTAEAVEVIVVIAEVVLVVTGDDVLEVVPEVVPEAKAVSIESVVLETDGATTSEVTIADEVG